MAAVITFSIYAYLGYKLGSNTFLWGFIGLGAFILCALLLAPILLLIDSPEVNLLYWTSVNMFGFVFPALLPLYIAYRNKLIFTRATQNS